MKKNNRIIKFSDALNEATFQLMKENEQVLLMGLGVTDPIGIFGTTKNLKDAFPEQVIETPTAENTTMGVAIGSSLLGMRPIITHQRVEFALLAIEQIVNQAAKWHYMTNGLYSVPIVIRLIVGRGWGQGPQHSQSLDSWFAHIPGLKVVVPSNAYEAKGMLISATRDNNPVIMIEHRWLHNTLSYVPPEMFEVSLFGSKVVHSGDQITLVTYSYMVSEAILAAEILEKHGVQIEVIDIRCHRPIDVETIRVSLMKTKKLITLDNSWIEFSIGSEVISKIVESEVSLLSKSPIRLGIADTPIPSTRSLANSVYPGQKQIVKAVASLLEINLTELIENLPDTVDVPTVRFSGPF